MKLKFELIIDADREAVWEAFDNADHMQRWQRTLVSYEHRSGEPGVPGSVAKLVYDVNGRRTIMTETISEHRKPVFMAGIYETSHSTTLVFNTFEQIDEQHTRWVAWTNMNFKGLMRLTSIFLIKSIRRRTEDDMQRFKLMVETDLANEAS